MKFNKSRVFTSLNAENIPLNTWVYVANNLNSLRTKVENDSSEEYLLIEVLSDSNDRRFRTKDPDTLWNLAYPLRFDIPHSKAEMELNLENNLP